MFIMRIGHDGPNGAQRYYRYILLSLRTKFQTSVAMSKEDYSHLNFTDTSDGSKTLYNSRVGEHYHSRHGALQESRHVFVETGLRHYLRLSGTREASVLEVGFGTGLNFLLTADFTETENIQLSYTGIEAYPLPEEIISSTGYKQYVGEHLWDRFIETYPESFSGKVRISANTQLEILHSALLDFETDSSFDVIYFDAFAAVHQPEMWSAESLRHVSRYLNPGGVFVTYAITGELKRNMSTLGFSIEKAPGAPGKREMLRAIRN